MVSIYEEIEIEDMAFDGENEVYTYPCPCGDKFSISLLDLLDGEDVADCPSCTLKLRIVYDEDSLPTPKDEVDDS